MQFILKLYITRNKNLKNLSFDQLFLIDLFDLLSFFQSSFTLDIFYLFIFLIYFQEENEIVSLLFLQYHSLLQEVLKKCTF